MTVLKKGTQKTYYFDGFGQLTFSKTFAVKTIGSDISRESFCGYCSAPRLGNAQRRVFAVDLGGFMAE